MTLAKVIELVGESTTGWEDAVKDAVEKASQSVDNITGVEVYNLTGHVKDGKLVEYKANVKLAFGLNDR
ncbi:MAG: hypothetical protein CVU88_03350 [Firmicutes bacterium HGW-Firmicutes-13]|nr:MAG: hypothetical protein CVU88_03350 [Firmicutes bacterium HGW-Firmicutes-13]